MTNSEPIEQWRKEFFGVYPSAKEVPYSYAHGFMDYETDKVWHGFKLAKRSQPVIELPSPRNIDFGTLNNINEIACFSLYEVNSAITAAGYQYKIKE